MAILNHGSTIRTTDGGQSTATIVTSANIGSYAVASNATYYIGTTQNIFNRASGAQTLTGVSIDGNAANITAYTINQNVGSSNSPTFATLQLTRLNFGATGTTPYAAASGEGIGNGITFGGDEAGNGYRIFTAIENIGGNYSKLTFNWHTGIRIGAAYQYGGTRFYNNSVGVGTEIFSVGNLDNNVRVINTIYAQSFYDINNTSYYLDAANSGTSLLVAGNVGIGTTSPSQKLHVVGNIMVAPASSSWAEGLSFTMPTASTWGGLRWRREVANADGNHYVGYTGLDSTDDLVFGSNNGGTQINNNIRITKAGLVGIGTIPTQKFHVSGIGYSDTDFRAPIFYDSNDTNYYLNPASSSVLNTLSMAGTITGALDATVSFTGGVCTAASYNYVLNGANDTGNKLVIFVNGSSRTADGGVNALTIRNDGGAFVLGLGSYLTSILGSSVTINGNAALTSASTLTAGNLSGTIPSGVLGNSTLYVGTTAIALNRGSASQSLTGVNIDGSSGSCTGNAATATILQTARNINGTSFNGSAAITTATWGTARTLTIGSTGKSVDGSANVSWSLAELGAAATNQTMFIGTTSVAINRSSASQTLTGVSIDGSSASCTGNAATASNATQFGGEANTNFMRGLAGGTEANINNYTDNGFRTVSYTGHSKGLLSFTTGGSIGSVQQEYFYNIPTNGWRVRNKTDSTTWSSWGNVVMTDTNQGALTGTVITTGNSSGLSPTFTNLNAAVFYDSNNTAYYINPAGNSIVSSLTFDSNITIYKHNDRNLLIQGGGGTDAGLLGRGSSGQFAFQVYGSGSGSYGFLDGAWAGWDIRKVVDGDLFLNDNNTYYLNPGSTTNLNNLTVAGTMTFGTLAYTTGSRRSKNSSNVNVETVTGLVSPTGPTFLEIRGFCPTTMYRTTGDRPAPYGLGFGNGAESGGIMPIGAGDNLQEIMLYGANSGPTTFTFKRQVWEGTAQDPDGSNYYGSSVFSINTGTGAVTASTDIRSPIYYDQNDTSYYIDAASTSQLNQVASYYLRNLAGVSTDHQFGLYFNNSIDTAYAIYREGGSWTGPYPDLRIAFHTGIKIGANAGYNGVRFYDDYGMGTQVMSVNNGSDGLGANNVYVNNALQAGGSLRAPIFYDSNDTTYYVDPNSLSNIRHTIFHIGSNLVGATGVGVLFDGNYTTGQYRHRFRKYDDGAGLPLYIDYAHATANSFTAIARFGGGGSYNPFSVYGTADASGDFRAPIFYDSNDTGYYLDPRSASVLSGLKLNGIGNDAAGNTSDAILWINKPDNNDWGIRVTGNLEYLLKLEGATSHTYNIQGLANGSEFWRCGTDLLYHNSNIRAPIFYDTNNTAYYVDPNSTSNLVGLTVANTITGSVSGSSGSCTGNSATATRTSSQSGYPHAGTGMFAFYNWGGTDGGTSAPSASTYTTGISVGSNPGDQAYGFQIANNMWNTGLWTRNYNSSFGAWIRLLDSSNYVGYSAFTSSLTSTVDARAPIFYDSNNTAYYIDAASTSVLNNIRTATISAANHGLTCVYYGGGATPTNGYLITTNIDYSTFNMPTVIIEGYAYGSAAPIHLEIVWYAYNNSWTNLSYTNLGAWDPGTISIGTNANGKVCLHLSGLIYYGRFNVRCIYDQGNAPLEGWTVTDATTSALTRVTTISKSAIVTSITGNAATVTNGLTTGNYNSYAPTLTGTGASGSWGISVTGSSASCTGNSATTTLATKATRANGNFYIDDNYGNTVVGLYSASRYQGVFAMGDSYKLAADGTTTGTLYGIAWSHPNAGGVAANLNTHGALILENGAFLAALSGSIRSRDDMRSPIFYDSNNTTYYVDPASTGYSAYFAGAIQATKIGIEDGGLDCYMEITDANPTVYGVGYGGEFIFYGDKSTPASFLYYGGATVTYTLQANSSLRSPIFYDSNDTGYYIDAASTSSLNSLISTEVYARNWFRNDDSGEGIYNQATTQHFYSDDVSYWNVASSSGAQGIRFRTGGHGGTVRGYVYANDSNDVGLLNNGGNWRIRVVGGDYVLFDGSSIRAPIFYDSNNTAYYIDGASTSNLNGLNIVDGNLELYKSQTIDMSNTTTYSTSNYYPVTISVPTEGCIIQIQNNLNSNVPSWATHGSGFTLNLRWRTNGSGWGTTEVRRYIEQYHERFANQTICGGITQMSNSSIEVVWLRGGGQYYFKFSRNLSATAQAVAYTINSQTVTPGSTAQNTIWNAYSGYSILYNNQTVSTDNMYTPVLYDWNNSAYYVDPASTSNLVGLTVANTITGSITGNAGGSSASCTGNAATVTDGMYLSGTQTITGIKYFQSNLGTTLGSLSDARLQAYATGTNAAFMSFHRAGNYAVNMGLDSDNVLRIGGWSASANRLQLDMSGNLTLAGVVDATQFRDSSDTAYYLDPAGTSNLNKFSTLTMSYNGMNAMSASSPYVNRYNGSALYRNGTMGYGTVDCNVIFSNWGSGFIDTWGNPANAPGNSTHYVGFQGFHYNHQDNSQAYGFQMLCAGEANNRFFWRSAWPTLRSWVEMIHTGNYNSYSPTLTGTGASGSWGINVTGSSASCTGNAVTATSATYLNSSNYIQRSGSSGNYNTDFQNTPAGSIRYHGDDYAITNNPGGGWWFVNSYRHSNGNGYWGTQVAWGWDDQANKLATRNVNNGTFGSWIYYLNSVNYNSYSPTLTGAGASGSWGISVTGSSASCTGNAANVTGTVAIANGGTGATTNANARTNLGATTVGSNLFTLTNPSAITFLRVNADNTVSALNASDFRNAIGAGGGGVTVETSVTQSLSGTTGCTIDVAAANVHILSLANATTISSFTYNNRSNNPSVNTLMIVLKYAGNASITWTNVIWSNNINPTLTQVSGYADVFMLTSYKGGAGTPVWIGTVVAAGLVSTNL